jgi:aspartyl-tRNA(Asn)/glutamyl-tRNA(Gln) amidotransferase subunit B
MKNVNSFRNAVRAMDYERKRQIGTLEDGGVIEQETRRWDDAAGVSAVLRSKEDAHDYRYFPEPDLLPIVIDEAWVGRIRETLPELPEARKARYIKDFSLPVYDAWVVTSSKSMADYFDACADAGANPKTAANWLMGDVSKLLNDRGLDFADVPFPAARLAELLALIEKGVISNNAAKKVLSAMFDSGGSEKSPAELVETLGLTQVSDEGALSRIIGEILAQNEKVVADFKGGNEKAAGFLVGQVMRASRGKANPQIVNKMLLDKLTKM